MPPTIFRGLTLDRFQVEACAHIDAGSSVVVSAATGTGKTVIADYLIEHSVRDGKKVFYTAPIKALSNQKYADFKASYGAENVGIMTGDVVHNPTAPVIVMTTEIYRNMLLARDRVTDDLAAVVFDEIHYLGDEERGTAWEESVIFSPAHVRFLCLSATIPNARQFARWIESIKGHPVPVVVESKRAVPLEHACFDVRFGISTLDEIRQRVRKNAYARYREPPRSRAKRGSGKQRLHGREERRAPVITDRMTHVDLIRALERGEFLPCIYFCFSRANTEKKARELASRTGFLDPARQERARALITERLSLLDPAIRRLETTTELARCIERGVAFHHAGILPALKELVEVAFGEGLLTVLYATETFAVGINMPARTVCFDSLEKYDGTRFRYLSSKEYFQLAGRAGRRGMDTVGHAIAVVDPEFADLGEIARVTAGDTEPLISQYKLSNNTILNLIAGHTPEERQVILKSSFATYQAAGKHAERILIAYDKKLAKLRELEYVERIGDDDRLTSRGEFARLIYGHELILTELFTTTVATGLSELHCILIAGALEFQDKRGVTFARGDAPSTDAFLATLKPYPTIQRYFRDSAMRVIEPVLSRWYGNGGFADLLQVTTMPEGDIVRFMRRIIDVLSQVERATTDVTLAEKIRRAIIAIDRDVVQVVV